MGVNPDLLVIKKPSELDIAAAFDPGNFLFAGDDDKLRKIPADVFYPLLNNVAKPISPADSTPTSVGWYKPQVSSEDPGTNYPNAGNLKSKSGFDTLFFFDGTNWIKAEVALPGVNNATDIEFRNKVDDKSFSPKQLFDEVIGEFTFGGTVQDLVMNLPAGFDINNANTADLPGAARFTYDPNLYSDFEYFTSMDVKFITTGTINIYVYSKTDLNTPYQTIPVNVTSVGVQNVPFSSPIDASQYLIFISAGVGYYVLTGATSARNLYAGSLGTVNDVLIGVIFRGTKTIGESTKKIIDQINELRELNFDFNNTLYQRSNGEIDSIISESGSSTFSIGSNGLTISSSGVGNGVIINKQYNLGQRFIELKVKFSSNTKFYIGTQYSENNVGKAFSIIDSVAKTITIYNIDSTSSVATTTTFTFDIIDGREYVLRLYKLNNLTKVEFIDPFTGNKSSAQVSQLGQFDKYKFGFVSSTASPVISSIAVKSIITERPFIGFYGDSITEGNTVGTSANTPYYKDRFANLIGSKLNKSYYVSGRSAGTIDGVLSRVQNELPYLRPKYVFITIGTNGGNTDAKLNQLVEFCESYDCKVILNLIPLYDSSTASKNSMIQTVVDARKLLSVKMNVATSVNADGVTKDNALFANESGVYIHPNVAGNQKIYERSLIDIAEVYQDVGIY
ncbi:Lysophospholipase L1 [Chryseobacterium oranimense]|uniref:Lysophospholipase L1 n=1 Tax=Chryseobacterium oranimense TaxID=421058 RepID=A0A1M5V047_9FLAO|nr:SGNH/GDSL hydrolase family protein [Chryseobacterium oranimense]SHH68677.1 Lysophospholipase L1 [Chryseobacterium oranimense]